MSRSAKRSPVSVQTLLWTAAGVATTALVGVASIAVTVAAPAPGAVHDVEAGSRLLPHVLAAPLPPLPDLQPTPGGGYTCPLMTDYLFDFGSAVLRADAERLLERCLPAVTRAAAAAGPPVRVVGYADGVGDAGFNQTLSERRSSQVCDWYQGRGVPAQRCVPEGRGETDAVDGVSDATRRKVVVEIPT